MRPGDVVLVRGDDLPGRLIRWGQRLRGDGPYAGWTHAAIAVSPGRVVEATAQGVVVSRLAERDPRTYRVVDVGASREDRAEAVLFVVAQIGRSYGVLAVAALFAQLLTGWRVFVEVEGTFTCSGLVARALERAGYVFDGDPAAASPADLGRVLGARP